MRLPLVNVDPADDQDHLFPPDQTLPPKCACGTTDSTMCRWQNDRDHGGLAGKQPRTCLNRKGQTDLPEGY